MRIQKEFQVQNSERSLGGANKMQLTCRARLLKKTFEIKKPKKQKNQKTKK